jgi:hypothetical protein
MRHVPVLLDPNCRAAARRLTIIPLFSRNGRSQTPHASQTAPENKSFFASFFKKRGFFFF